jgi:hypothetical protein
MREKIVFCLAVVSLFCIQARAAFAADGSGQADLAVQAAEQMSPQELKAAAIEHVAMKLDLQSRPAPRDFCPPTNPCNPRTQCGNCQCNNAGCSGNGSISCEIIACDGTSSSFSQSCSCPLPSECFCPTCNPFH